MTSQSKCENSDAYGICLTQKAMKLLYAKFDPDGSIRKHLRTADQHRLKDRLHAQNHMPTKLPGFKSAPCTPTATTLCRTGSPMLCADYISKGDRE
ncbi:MAG: hypothetical protein ACLU3I_11805 [Acutalibacteraceae bacterium]